MKGGADRFPSSIYTESTDWKSLTPDSVVVDVGGNVGKVTHELYKAFPHLKYVVQDLPPVVKDARNVNHSYSSLPPALPPNNNNPVLG
jgi:O-methyltransferase domain